MSYKISWLSPDDGFTYFISRSEDKSEDTKGTERKPRHKNRRDRTKDPRTVFVGNLPISYDKKVTYQYLMTKR